MAQVSSTIRIGVLLFIAAAIAPRVTAQAPAPATQPPAEPAKQTAEPAKPTVAPAPDPATVAAQEEFIKLAVYDVASIHKYKYDGGPMTVFSRSDPDGFTGMHVSLESLICEAYAADFCHVSGDPEWVQNDDYDVNAKMDEQTASMLRTLSPRQEQLARHHMMQSLLADRLKLKVHFETKQFSVYHLVIAKGGTKLHEAKKEDDYANGFQGADGKSLGRGSMLMGFESGAMAMHAQAVSIENFTRQLSGQLGANVVNDTGLKGEYDFTLRFTPESMRLDAPNPAGGGSVSLSGSGGASLPAALEEQLGLKLESQKSPAAVIVIDHIEPPSEN